MQKLNSPTVKNPFANSRGSALVGAVAFSIILFIASLGYLQFLASTRNKEVESLRDDKVFCAAESGLFLATRWLSQQTVIPPLDSTPVYALQFGDIAVNVSVIPKSATVAEIRATASTNKLTYKKQISWAVWPRPAGSYGVYIDNAFVFGGNSDGIRKITWDGPAHFNTALNLGQSGTGNEAHFKDRVTLYNIDPTTNMPYIDMTRLPYPGRLGNDYRYGVQGGAINLDNDFLSTYNPNADRIAVQLNTSVSTNISLYAGDSSLVFGVNAGTGVPFYRYKDGAGNATTISYDQSTEIKLHIINKGVAVSGSVKGKITVYTDTGRGIHIPGSLTYADFSNTSFSSTDAAANYGYGMTSENILGLYSGADYTIADGVHYITALMFATSDNASVKFLRDKNSTTLNLFGTLAVSTFWDPKQGNDQALVNNLWDRRALNAPGLGYRLVIDNNNFGLVLNAGSWREENFKP